MVRGFYTAGSGMLTSMRKLDSTGANIANARTVAYKKQGVVAASFQERLIVKLDSLSDQTAAPLGTISLGQTVDSNYTDFEQGALDYTGSPLQMALEGEGFFTLQTAAGLRYTRNGECFVDNEGYLAHTGGGRLWGANGLVYVGGAGFSVAENGAVAVGGREVNRLAIYVPTDPAAMTRQGGGLFTAGGAAGVFTGRVRQGHVEHANVSMMDEMMDMMRNQRSFQSCSQALKIIDETLDRADEVGRAH